MEKKILTLIGLLATAFAGYSQTVPPPESLARESAIIGHAKYYQIFLPYNTGTPVSFDAYDVTIAEDDDYLYVQGLFNNPNDSAVKNAWAVAKKIPEGIEFIQGQKITEDLYLYSGLLRSGLSGWYPDMSCNLFANPCGRKLYSEDCWNDDDQGNATIKSILYETEEPRPTNYSYKEGYVPDPVSAIWLTGDYAGSLYYEEVGMAFSDYRDIILAPVIRKMSSGVGSISDDPDPESDIIYDLSGRRVSSDNLQPGIYIRNHRKFIVR